MKSQLHCLPTYPSPTGLRDAFGPEPCNRHTVPGFCTLLNHCSTSTLVTSDLPRHHGCVSGLLTGPGYSQRSFESVTCYYTSWMLCNQTLATRVAACLTTVTPRSPSLPRHTTLVQDISSQPLHASAEQHLCFSSCKWSSIKYLLNQYFKETATSIKAVAASSWEN